MITPEFFEKCENKLDECHAKAWLEEVEVSRITATKYLNQLTEHGFVSKHKMGRNNYYVNEPLVKLIMQQEE